MVKFLIFIFIMTLNLQKASADLIDPGYNGCPGALSRLNLKSSKVLGDPFLTLKGLEELLEIQNSHLRNANTMSVDLRPGQVDVFPYYTELIDHYLNSLAPAWNRRAKSSPVFISKKLLPLISDLTKEFQEIRTNKKLTLEQLISLLRRLSLLRTMFYETVKYASKVEGDINPVLENLATNWSSAFESTKRSPPILNEGFLLVTFKRPSPLANYRLLTQRAAYFYFSMDPAVIESSPEEFFISQSAIAQRSLKKNSHWASVMIAEQKADWAAFIDKMSLIKSAKQKELIARVIEQLFGVPLTNPGLTKTEQVQSLPIPKKVWEALLRLRDAPSTEIGKVNRKLLLETIKTVEESLLP